jgi:hypothetical protein
LVPFFSWFNPQHLLEFLNILWREPGGNQGAKRSHKNPEISRHINLNQKISVTKADQTAAFTSHIKTKKISQRKSGLGLRRLHSPIRRPNPFKQNQEYQPRQRITGPKKEGTNVRWTMETVRCVARYRQKTRIWWPEQVRKPFETKVRV